VAFFAKRGLQGNERVTRRSLDPSPGERERKVEKKPDRRNLSIRGGENQSTNSAVFLLS